MGRGVLIIGSSGTGKSTAVRTLDPKETFIINVQGKDLPFQGAYKNYPVCEPSKGPGSGKMYITDKAETILQVMDYVSEKMPEIKTLVIDDYQYSAANEFMATAEQKGYDKFTMMGKHIWQLANRPKYLRKDLTVFFLTHDEEAMDATGTRKKKAKTVGKLVDNVITLEGMFTIVLYTDVLKSKDGFEYVFITQNDGTNSAKSPMGMFKDHHIPNDLKYVNEAIHKFYNS